MYTNNYDFKAVNVVKVITKNKDGRILLIQEPENNEWMPLHWGLPGGKPTENESLLETFERKSTTDVGQKLELEGLLEIEELLLEGRTVFMYILAARANSGIVNGEAKTYKWVNKNDIERMKSEEFTEYYNKDLLMRYFNSQLTPVPFSAIKTWEYYKMKDEKPYIKWFNSGNK